MLHEYSLALFAILITTVIGAGNPHVTLPQGALMGRVMKSAKGKEFQAFRGIPYAKPPIEELRLKPTQPAQPWEGVFDGSNEGPACPQFDPLFTYKLTGQEDCLILNVYTPQLPKGNKNVKLPVMVFIHGGGFVLGSSKTNLYPAKKFMDKDVVLVTINYRLGALGFLSTGDEVIPGNYGLYDQVEALKWVKKNIVYFGGDPEKVTIFGGSAGGASVSYLVASPKAKDLFQAAILQSGSSISEWAAADNPIKWAKALAIRLGCSAHTSQRIFDCIKTKTAEEIVMAQQNLKIIPFSMIFTPVFENTPKGFFPEHPIKLFTSNKNNKVPVILGVNKDEGAFRVAIHGALFDLYSPDFRETDFLEISPTENLVENRVEVTKEVVNHYFKNVDRSNKTEYLGALIQLYSDSFYNVGIERLTQILSKNHLPTYTYMFTYRGKASFTDLYGITEDLGVSHTDELQYLFHGFSEKELEGNDIEMSEIFLSLWTNFAKTHDPTTGNDLPFKWLKTESSPRYLDINLHPTMVNKKLTENVEFWTKIWERYRIQI